MATIESIVKSLSMLDEHTVEFVLHNNIAIDQSAMISIIHHFDKFTGGRKLKRLIVIGPSTEISKEARFYWQKISNEKRNIVLAEAILVHTLAQKMIANFYFNYIKNRYPTKFFTDIDKAKEWLKMQGGE